MPTPDPEEQPPMPEDAGPEKIWVVWSPQGGPPVARMTSFNVARSAAIRLSKKFPEQDFFVLASCWGRIATPAGPVDADTPEPEAGASP
jgi:hypothetical protein